MNGDELRRARLRSGLSQAEVAGRLEVAQATISNWEKGKGSPNKDQSQKLGSFLGRIAEGDKELRGEAEGDQLPPFATWVTRTRTRLALTVPELATKAGISVAGLYNIEYGRTANPRDETRNRIVAALGEQPSEDTVRATEEAAEVEGIGSLQDFEPHDDGDLPREPGVYVFYDISQRPVYVGMSSDIRKRIRSDHKERFWFRSPIVETASYIKISDKTLREQIERILIKFLKANAVINKQNVERERD